MKMDPVELTPLQEHELSQLVEGWNETLRAAGAGSAELALGLVIRMGFLPVLGVVLVLFLFKVINVILAIVLLVIVSLVLVGISMLISERARLKAMEQVYHSRVEPEIAQFTHKHGIPRQQVETFMHPLLPVQAPLKTFLSTAMPNLGKANIDGGNQEEE